MQLFATNWTDPVIFKYIVHTTNIIVMTEYKPLREQTNDSHHIRCIIYGTLQIEIFSQFQHKVKSSLLSIGMIPFHKITELHIQTHV